MTDKLPPLPEPKDLYYDPNELLVWGAEIRRLALEEAVAAVEKFGEEVRRIAFEIPAPNVYTPRLVLAAITAKNAAIRSLKNEQQRTE